MDILNLTLAVLAFLLAVWGLLLAIRTTRQGSRMEDLIEKAKAATARLEEQSEEIAAQAADAAKSGRIVLAVNRLARVEALSAALQPLFDRVARVPTGRGTSYASGQFDRTGASQFVPALRDAVLGLPDVQRPDCFHLLNRLEWLVTPPRYDPAPRGIADLGKEVEAAGIECGRLRGQVIEVLIEMQQQTPPTSDSGGSSGG